MARLLFMTDPHGESELYEAVVELANLRNIPMLTIGGNFLDKQVVVPVGDGRGAPIHHLELIYNRTLESVLTGDELNKYKTSVKSPEALLQYVQGLSQETRTKIESEFEKLVESEALKPIKDILRTYKGVIVGEIGNHDPDFAKKSLEEVITFPEDGQEVNGLRFVTRTAAFEKPGIVGQAVKAYSHLNGYEPTKDSDLGEVVDDGTAKDADIYLFHKPIGDRFCQESRDKTYDKKAGALIEIAKKRGRTPLILSGHFHSPKSGGGDQGYLQFRGAPNYFFEFFIDDNTKKLEKVIVYEYVGKQKDVPKIPHYLSGAAA